MSAGACGRYSGGGGGQGGGGGGSFARDDGLDLHSEIRQRAVEHHRDAAAATSAAGLTWAHGGNSIVTPPSVGRAAGALAADHGSIEICWVWERNCDLLCSLVAGGTELAFRRAVFGARSCSLMLPAVVRARCPPRGISPVVIGVCDSAPLWQCEAHTARRESASAR